MSPRQVNLTALRERAEQAIADSEAKLLDHAGQTVETEFHHLVEELHIYQTELEIQNEELVQAQSTIALALEKYRMLFDHLPLPGFVVDATGFIKEANSQACDFLGLSRNVSLQRGSVFQFFDFDSRMKLVPVLKDKLRQEPQTLEFLGVYIGDAQTIPCDVHVMHLSAKSVHGGQTLLILLDRTADLALHESEERFRKLFEDTHLANTLIEDGRFVAVNKAALRMLRMNRPDQLLGLTPDTISPPLQPDGQPSAEKAAELIRTVTQQGSIDFEWEHIRADGERFLAQVSVTVIRYHNKDLLHNVWHDITEQKKTRQQIEHMAFHDSLTGLPNRVLGHDRLQHAVATASQHHSGLAVLCLDLNKFKYINDTHGHVVGDLLLKGVALRLTRHLRAEDTLCRLSADAFMMVLPEVQSQHLVSQVVSACERLLASLAEPFELEGLQLLTSISIGVAIYPQDGSDSETLIRHSDTALFEAKKAGHHTYRFFEPQMNAVLSRFVKTRAALQSALEHQEFELYYQPQVDLRRRRVVGVESLIRWRRPDAGLTLPDAFIDVAEESGLIVPIGRWVLHEACRQAAAWHAAGWTNLVMAVNLSAVQFRQRQVSLDVVAALEDSGLDPTCLDLELTESILLQNETAVLDTVAAWKARGIQLSIDDFGTGYSSLAYLKRFKVDKLKIDRSFIINLLINEEDRAIVQAIIQIARSLNLRTIAEGVEDALMADQLKIMGCDEIQGYLYSKPLPAAAFEQWLDNHRSIG